MSIGSTKGIKGCNGIGPLLKNMGSTMYQFLMQASPCSFDSRWFKLCPPGPWVGLTMGGSLGRFTMGGSLNRFTMGGSLGRFTMGV